MSRRLPAIPMARRTTALPCYGLPGVARTWGAWGLALGLGWGGWTAGSARGADETLTLFDLSIEQLMEIQVSTVSRVDERIDEAPGNVYVFPRSVIQQRGYRSLKELLQVVPGFTVLHRDLQFVAGVRGLNANDNEKITLLINGQELNQINEPEFLNGPINLDTVERVEVVVGPSSLYQQANTLAATVNVITRDEDGTAVVLSTGSDVPYSGSLMTGKRWEEDRFVSFSITTECKDGFDAWDPAFRPHLAGGEETGELRWPSVFSVLRGQAGDWKGQAIAYRTELPELLINNGHPDNQAESWDEMYALAVENEHGWNEDLVSMARLTATYKRTARKNSSGPPVPMTGLEQFLSQRDYTADLGLRYRGWDRHDVQAGVQGAYEDNFDCTYTFNLEEITLIDEDTQAVGLYLSDRIQLSERIKLIGGVRTDYTTLLDGDDWFWGGRAALVTRPADNWVSKLMFNRSVRMPSPLAALNKAWGNDKLDAPVFADLSPNADHPEVLSTVSLGNIVYVGHARVSVTLYHQELDDFISWFAPHTNIGDFEGNGVELDALSPIHPRLTLWGNISYNDSELTPRREFRLTEDVPIEQHHAVINEDGRIIGAPEWTANGGCDIEIREHIKFSPSLRFFANQPAYDPMAQASYDIEERAYLDAAITWERIRGRDVDIRLAGTNLLDNRDDVSGQWLRGTYQPRGAAVVATVYLNF